jgi:hypothetical protein
MFLLSEFVLKMYEVSLFVVMVALLLELCVFMYIWWEGVESRGL